MSFDDFMTNPKSYLIGHKVTVRSDACILQSMTVGTREDCLGGDLRCEEWIYKVGGPHLTMMRMIAKGDKIQGSFRKAVGVQLGKLPFQKLSEREYQLFPNGTIDKGFRWLMYVENVATYMRADPGATLIMTGPLSGCTIAFGRDGAGTPTMIHANCNRASGNVARLQQANMIVNVCRDKIAGNAGRMIHATYQTDYSGMGFVFAQLKGAIWRVYAYGTDSGVKKIGEI